MIYAIAGFVVVAATVLARRFAKVWRRESARIDQILTEFDAEKAARSDENANQIAARTQ